jgi:hypothetical protein
MIIAGIDEAGYGPLLGPLVVGCCAMEVASPDGAVPDLWKWLRRICGKSRDASGKRIHVNDSKKVYSPSVGVSELERAVLTLSGLSVGAMPTSLDEVLARHASRCAPDLAKIPWYVPLEGETFPVEAGATSLALQFNSARHEFTRAAVRVVHLNAFAVDERRLNRMFQATRNKSSTSFTYVATHLDDLMKRYADQDLVIYCDRQGGREHYGRVLQQMFEEWHLEVTSEQPTRAEYRLSNGPRAARIIFAEKGEGECMSVAVASMLAKYLRETLMHRFNAYWKQHAPELKPTAGYWTDGQRWVAEMTPELQGLGIDPQTLVRAR